MLTGQHRLHVQKITLTASAGQPVSLTCPDTPASTHPSVHRFAGELVAALSIHRTPSADGLHFTFNYARIATNWRPE